MQGGIREIGIIETIDLEIANTWDVTIKQNRDVRNALVKVFEQKPKYIIAHNAHIEKNLIKDYLPYPKIEKGSASTKHWGPWLDTLTTYRTLYPTMKDFSLENLTSTFIDKKQLNEMAEKVCKKDRIKPHFALYDALCTLLLVRRIDEKVDLSAFIK